MAERLKVKVNDGQEKVSIFVQSGYQQIPTKTSQLINDGSDGTNPFISNTAIQNFTDIASLLAGQGAQIEDGVYGVANASADPALTFPSGETRLQAYYRYLGTTNGTMADYELISAPYGNHTQIPFIFNKVNIDPTPLISPRPDEWDENIREIGNWFDDGDAIYQFYTGVNGTSGINSRVGYAKSVDGGKTFTNGNILFDTPAEDPYIIKVNGTYFCYTEESSVNAKKIQVHTATSIEGTWTYQGLAIDVGGGTTWDADSLGSPLPVYRDGEFILFYEGLDLGGGQLGAIGYATSNDGINFTKNANPIIVGNTFSFLKPSYDLSDVLVIDWAKIVVPDDIVTIDGINYMSIHANANGFKIGLVASENLTSNYYDVLKTNLASNTISEPDDLMFVKYNGNFFSIIQYEDKIYKFNFGIEGTNILKANFSTDQDVTVGRRLNILGDVNAEGLQKFETQEGALGSGVEYEELFINNQNLVVKRNLIKNIVLNSEPTEAEGGSSNVAYEAYNWGYNDFETCIRFDGGSYPKYHYAGIGVAGKWYNYSFYVRMDDGSIPVVAVNNNQYNADFRLNLGGGIVTDYGSISVTNVFGEIYRVSVSKLATGSGAINGIRLQSEYSGKSFRMTGIQMTEGKILNPYQKTPFTQTIQKTLLEFDGVDVKPYTQAEHTGTVIPLNNPMGSVNNTPAWNAEYTLGDLVKGGNAKDLIDTTSQTEFPIIPGAQLMPGSEFAEGAIFEMITYTDNGTDVFYFFLIRNYISV